jgi:septum formation protein
MLVLASASPRRSELLTQIGLQFRIHPAHINEDPLPGEDPSAYVARLAREKAEAVYRELTAQQNSAPTLMVLGADTTVTLDNHILGKPNDHADAARMLNLLSGRTHQVLTGVALVSACATQLATETTSVTFSLLTPAEIAAYVASGEPLDKAGAYAIQGLAARWIPRIEGCYFNVVGLPLALVCSMLEKIS